MIGFQYLPGRSPIMTQRAMVLPVVTRGMMDPSGQFRVSAKIT
jgi:hypothetical protein